MTLPLIHARESLEPRDRKLFLAALVADPATARDALMNYLARHDSLNFARAEAQLYADRAQADLAALADSPARDALASLTDFAIARRG